MKLSRMIYNDERQVPFEDELNRFIRTEITDNPNLYYCLLRPFDNFFLRFLSFFIIGEVKCNKLLKKTPLWAADEAEVAATDTVQPNAR